MDLIKEEVIANLLAMWERVTPEQYEQGKNWYLKAHDFAVGLTMQHWLARKENTVTKVCGVIAALSPRNRWEDNKKDAVNVLFDWSQNKDLKDTALSSTHPKIENVIRILEGVYPTKTLGQKARSFFNCILNPLCDDVCVDSWAARAAGYNERWISKENYPVLQDYYREAAKSVGLGHTPALFQAIVWVVYRGSAE
jgi:hypothetical protein